MGWFLKHTTQIGILVPEPPHCTNDLQYYNLEN